MIKELGYGYQIVDNKYIFCYDKEVFKKFYKVIDYETFQIVLPIQK